MSDLSRKQIYSHFRKGSSFPLLICNVKPLIKAFHRLKSSNIGLKNRISVFLPRFFAHTRMGLKAWQTFVILFAFALNCFPASAQEMEEFDPPGTTYFLGLEKTPPEILKAQPRAPRFRAFLPPTADLTASMPRPGNQGQQGSCVAWAVGFAARTYYVSAREARKVTSSENIVSPAFIYNSLVKREKPRCVEGLYIADALDLLKSGAASLNQYPYAANRCDPPSEEIRRQASDFRIDSWFAIPPSEIETIKGEVSTGNPVVFGMTLAKSFDDHRGPGTYRRRPSEPFQPSDVYPGSFAGHAMVVVGYDDARQAFRVQNSWGRGWGDKGYVWLSYETFKADVDEAYVMRPLVKELPPRPIPEPEPSPGVSDLANQLSALKLSCGSVSKDISSGRSRVVGFVENDGDLKQVAAVAARAGADLNVAVRPWPQCEALLTLSDAITAADRPRVTLASARTRFRAGDRLEFSVRTPARPGYVHVAYVQADGSTVHLVQSAGTSLKTIDPSSDLIFGDGLSGRPRFTVSAPFGRELLIVVTSASPLFQQPRPQQETDREFLSALRFALNHGIETRHRRAVAAAVIGIQTEP